MVRFYNNEETSFLNDLLSSFNSVIDLDSNPFYKCLVYDDGTIKGCLVFEQIYERIELDYIIVNNNYRRYGIASKLLEFLIEYSKSNCISNITLEVNESNIAALNLYKKYGFGIVSSRKNYYKNKNAILMIRKFDSNE